MRHFRLWKAQKPLLAAVKTAAICPKYSADAAFRPRSAPKYKPSPRLWPVQGAETAIFLCEIARNVEKADVTCRIRPHWHNLPAYEDRNSVFGMKPLIGFVVFA